MAAKKTVKKTPDRVKVALSFELDREILPSQKDLEAALFGAVKAILKDQEFYSDGSMSARFVRRLR